MKHDRREEDAPGDTSPAVNGRPALGISELPGSRANTVW